MLQSSYMLTKEDEDEFDKFVSCYHKGEAAKPDFQSGAEKTQLLHQFPKKFATINQSPSLTPPKDIQLMKALCEHTLCIYLNVHTSLRNNVEYKNNPIIECGNKFKRCTLIPGIFMSTGIHSGAMYCMCA
jgi:hypothetical protein